MRRFLIRPGESWRADTHRVQPGLRFYLARAGLPATWRRLLQGRIPPAVLGALARRLGARAGIGLAHLRGRLTGKESERAHVLGLVRGLLARRVGLLMLYSEGDSALDELETYLGRHGRRVRREPGLRLEILKGADHTLSSRHDQERLGLLVDAWLDAGQGSRARSALDAARSAARITAAARPSRLALPDIFV